MTATSDPNPDEIRGAKSANDLLDRLKAGDRAAVSEALNLVDDDRPARRAEALDLLDAIHRSGAAHRALRVGVTGPPGAGKSSLLNALVAFLADKSEGIGIIAVDPSSQRSGGALLVTGAFWGTTVLGSSLTSKGDADLFVWKLSAP